MSVYPLVLRRTADLIEEHRFMEVNLAALIEITEYLRRKQLKSILEEAGLTEGSRSDEESS
jgi:hypothetical protein